MSALVRNHADDKFHSENTSCFGSVGKLLPLHDVWSDFYSLQYEVGYTRRTRPDSGNASLIRQRRVKTLDNANEAAHRWGVGVGGWGSARMHAWLVQRGLPHALILVHRTLAMVRRTVRYVVFPPVSSLDLPDITRNQSTCVHLALVHRFTKRLGQLTSHSSGIMTCTCGARGFLVIGFTIK